LQAQASRILSGRARKADRSATPAEGVRFDETGQASPEGRLTADDLQALLGWFDPDDDLPDEPEA
jgi:hypothetical protein